jgi:hypothetical protein
MCDSNAELREFLYVEFENPLTSSRLKATGVGGAQTLRFRQKQVCVSPLAHRMLKAMVDKIVMPRRERRGSGEPPI